MVMKGLRQFLKYGYLARKNVVHEFGGNYKNLKDKHHFYSDHKTMTERMDSVFKVGVNVKAVFTSLNTAFLPISRSRFKRRQIPMLITLSTIWQFCVNFWVIFRCFGKERFFLKG